MRSKGGGRRPYRPPQEQYPKAAALYAAAQGQKQPAKHSRAHEITLQDEARNTTSRDHTTWSRDSRLRHMAVTFVSSGSANPLDDEDTASKEESKAPAEGRSQRLVEIDDNGEVLPGSPTDDSRDSAKATQLPDQSKATNQEVAEELNHDMTKTDKGLTTVNCLSNEAEQPLDDSMSDKLDPSDSLVASRPSFDPAAQRPSPSSPKSVSSTEEVILFKGRSSHRTQKRATARKKDLKRFDLGEISAEIETVQQSYSSAQVAGYLISPMTSIKPNSHVKSQLLKPPSRLAHDQQDEDEAIMADYIANMQDYDGGGATGNKPSFATRLLGHDESELIAVVDSDDSSAENLARNASKSRGDKDDSSDPETDDGAKNGKRLCTDHEKISEPSSSANFNNGSMAGEYAPSAASDDFDMDSAEPWLSMPMIDGYGDFDIMDRDRPSLTRKKGKGSKAKLNLEGYEPDIAAALTVVYENDRMKKAERRRHREELRAQGRLGKNANPEDLRIKYPKGITLEQVMEELKKFLIGSANSLLLPPMDNHARKVVHEIANKLKLKSKSSGAGNERRPALFRSSSTLTYSEESFERAVAKIRRKYFKRPDMQIRGVDPHGIARASNAAAAAARVRDGDVVGQGAPALGIENKGRAMLEKMGWSMGMALGTTDNQGLLEPVTQVVKRTKAGLG